MHRAPTASSVLKGATQPGVLVTLQGLRAHCAACSMRELCLPVGLSPSELRQLDDLIGKRVRLQKGEALYQDGDAFTALYAVRMGSLKTVVLSEEGHEQVAGYHLLGDIIGLDGIATQHHGCQATALEQTEVCVLPFERLEELSASVPPLQRNLYRFLSREIARDHTTMLVLGSRRADQRLACFLLDLGERYRQRGYSSTEFVLRMTRNEIGSLLGMKLETVSRLFSRFQEEGVVQVQGRAVKLLDQPRLRQISGQAT